MNKSEEIKDLAAALCKAQSEMSGAKKKAANPFFKSKYANLEEIINCAKDALSDNGLSISQSPFAEEGTAGVTTLLMHESGQWLEGRLLLKCAKVDPQGMGSAITYARRYAYQSILGIPSEDDDGKRASKPTFTAPEETAPEAPEKTTPNFTAAFALCSDLAALEVKFNSAGCQKFKSDVDMMTAYGKRKQELS
jgi:hypothetical protein